MDREEMTAGEMYRLLQRIERDHGAMLSEIREQTIKTNGTVGRHEERIRVVERDVGRMQQQRAGVMQALAGGAGDTRSLTVSVPMDVKTVVILLTALATVILLVAKGGWPQ